MRAEYRLFNLVASLVLMTALLLPFWLSDQLASWMPVCPWTKKGMTCSACGLTRSVIALYRGNLEESRLLHDGGLIVIVTAAVQLCARPLVAALLRFAWLPWADLGQLTFTAFVLGELVRCM